MKIKNAAKSQPTTPKATTKTEVAAVKANAKPAPKAAEPKAEPKNGVNIGKSTGMRVMAFQDHTFLVNDKPDRRFTNDELAKVWRDEFPNSRAVLNGRITGEMVQAVRRLYNSGTGGHGTAGVKHESKPYIVQDGKRIVAAVPERKAKAPKAEPTEPAAKVAAPKPQPGAYKPTQPVDPKAGKKAKSPKAAAA